MADLVFVSCSLFVIVASPRGGPPLAGLRFFPSVFRCSRLRPGRDDRPCVADLSTSLENQLQQADFPWVQGKDSAQKAQTQPIPVRCTRSRIFRVTPPPAAAFSFRQTPQLDRSDPRSFRCPPHTLSHPDVQRKACSAKPARTHAGPAKQPDQTRNAHRIPSSVVRRQGAPLHGVKL